jgi:hypothetical protein
MLPPDFPTDKLAKAAVALLKIEEEAGQSYEQIVTRATELATQMKQFETTIASLKQEEGSLRKIIADLEKLRQDAYVKNSCTKPTALKHPNRTENPANQPQIKPLIHPQKTMKHATRLGYSKYA